MQSREELYRLLDNRLDEAVDTAEALGSIMVEEAVASGWVTVGITGFTLVTMWVFSFILMYKAYKDNNEDALSGAFCLSCLMSIPMLFIITHGAQAIVAPVTHVIESL